MMHCMMMMMSHLLSVMLSMILAAPVRWISVIKDKVVARLASPDLRHFALGHRYLPVVRMILMAWYGQLGRAIVVKLSRGVVRLHSHVVRFLVVLRRVFQRYIVLVQIDRERDTMMSRQHFHVRADRRHRGGWIQLHQGCLQLQGIHVSQSSLAIFQTTEKPRKNRRIDRSRADNPTRRLSWSFSWLTYRPDIGWRWSDENASSSIWSNRRRVSQPLSFTWSFFKRTATPAIVPSSLLFTWIFRETGRNHKTATWPLNSLPSYIESSHKYARAYFYASGTPFDSLATRSTRLRRNSTNKSNRFACFSDFHLITRLSVHSRSSRSTD